VKIIGYTGGGGGGGGGGAEYIMQMESLIAWQLYMKTLGMPRVSILPECPELYEYCHLVCSDLALLGKTKDLIIVFKM
jgi:hypothetical protein